MAAESLIGDSDTGMHWHHTRLPSLHTACLQWTVCLTVSAAKGLLLMLAPARGTHWRLTEEAVSCVPYQQDVGGRGQASGDMHDNDCGALPLVTC